MFRGLYWLLLLPRILSSDSPCVCTTVPCPQIGENNIIMGKGGANITFFYEEHQNIPVVIQGKGTVLPESLGNGSDTTDCTRKYARMLEDDGADSCDAGHILANHMGGYGNQPLNIFPQNSTINKGAYNQFESQIYDCILNSSVGFLEWEFMYASQNNTQPNKVTYYAKFEDSPCEPLYEEFTN